MLDDNRDATYDMIGSTSITKPDFDKRWSIIRHRMIPLPELSQMVNPPVEATIEVQVDYVIYMSKWISLGLDGSYFSSGAGAPDSCIIS
jgi:hypothetical protein